MRPTTLQKRSWFTVCQRKLFLYSKCSNHWWFQNVSFDLSSFKSQSEFVQFPSPSAEHQLHVSITFLHEKTKNVELSDFFLASADKNPSESLQWITENHWSCSEVTSSNISAALMFVWWRREAAEEKQNVTKHPQTEKNAKTAFLINKKWWNMKSSECKKEEFRAAGSVSVFDRHRCWNFTVGSDSRRLWWTISFNVAFSFSSFLWAASLSEKRSFKAAQFHMNRLSWANSCCLAELS